MRSYNFTPNIKRLAFASAGVIALSGCSVEALGPQPQIANPETFSFSFANGKAEATFPAVNATDGPFRITYECTDAGLKVSRKPDGLTRTFNQEGMDAMIHYGIASENPCDGGLTPPDADNLGRIAVRNGFGTFYSEVPRSNS